jgi:peptidoglycan/LPS O-acetylase OafA/YrhL
VNYRPEIDGLRAIAVVPVIFFHAGFEFFNGGFVGVDIFFVISGYLITTLILNELASKKFNLVTFYERRARRILPALLSTIFLIMPFAWLYFMPGDMKNFSESVIAATLFSSNVLFWKESGYFDIASESKPLIHTWSLAIEEQFYILFPLFLMLAWKLGKSIAAYLIILVFIISISLAHWGAYTHPTAAFFLLPTRGWELLMGSLVAFYVHEKSHDPNIKVSQTLSLLGLLLIIYSILYFNNDTPAPSLFTLIPTIGTSLLILYAIPGTAVSKIFSSKILVAAGLASYSLYLIHQPVFAIIRYRLGPESITEYIWIISAGIFILSYLSWRFIERPFRNKLLFSRTQIFSYSFIGILILLFIGVLGVYTNGFEDRFSNYERKVLAEYVDAGKYVSSRFDNLDQDFDINENTLNVLIIGDSFAEDMLNAVFESGLSSNYSISTRKIQAHCGNIFTDRDLSKYIRPQDLAGCKNGYEDKKLLERFKSAEEVWLVSSWRLWVVPMIQESIANIRKHAPQSKIKVFGRKHLGQRKANEFINSWNVDIDELLSIKPMPDVHIQVNESMKKLLHKEEFIDVSFILCGSTIQCSNKTPNMLPISYDGLHFTKSGAKYFGQKLSQNEILINNLNSKER